MFINTLFDSIEAFEYPWVLLFFLSVPIFYIVISFSTQSIAEHFRFSDISAIKEENHFSPQNSKSPVAHLKDLWRMRRSLRLWLFIISHICIILAFISLTFSIARPYGRESFEARTEGLDIIIALDMSNSMKAYDYSREELESKAASNVTLQNRYETAVSTIKAFIEKESSYCHITQRHPRCDRIGLVVFGQHAYMDVPPTNDYALFNKIIDRRNLDDIASQATAIGDGIMRSVASLRHAGPQARVIILLTDGDKKGGQTSLAQAIAAANAHDVSIYPILIGNAESSFIRIEKDDAYVWHPVHMPTDISLLNTVAAQTGGQTYESKNKEELVQSLTSILDTLETQLVEVNDPGNRIDYSRYFILITFFFGLLGYFFRLSFTRVYP